jgi:GT2 family glycosyltransferase
MAVTHSIVIVNFNNKTGLRAMLTALRLEESLSSEAVVVDNGSFDGSADMVRSEFPDVRLVRMGSNKGFAAAANAGIAKSLGQIVTLCHSDIVTTAHNLEDLADHLREAASRSVAVVAARVARPDGLEMPAAGKFPGFWRGLLGVFMPSRGLRRFVPKLDHANDREFATFVCASINPELLAVYGGFDARFFTYYADVDLCRRLHDKGQRILFDRNVCVVHVPSGNGNGRMAPHQKRLARRSQELYFEKHRPAWQAGVIRALGKWFVKDQ